MLSGLVFGFLIFRGAEHPLIDPLELQALRVEISPSEPSHSKSVETFAIAGFSALGKALSHLGPDLLQNLCYSSPEHQCSSAGEPRSFPAPFPAVLLLLRISALPLHLAPVVKELIGLF